MRRRLLVFAALLTFGLIRWPAEQALLQQRRAHHLEIGKVNLSLREQIGQLGVVAALSGFRSVVADLLFLEAHAAWERTAWTRVLLLLREATALQPRNVTFWDMAGWHMAWNASAAALRDPNESRFSQRLKRQREYFALGRDFLEQGIKYNPKSPLLYEALGRLLRDKYQDHVGAAAAFSKAAELPGAKSYLRRFAAYELSEVPGREPEAYSRLRQLYDRGQEERAPTLIRRLKMLEEKLDIAPEKRINDPAPPPPRP